MTEDENGLSELSERLATARPQPDPSFLDRLARLIESASPAADDQRRVGVRIAAFGVAGLLLLTVAAAVTFL